MRNHLEVTTDMEENWSQTLPFVVSPNQRKTVESQTKDTCLADEPCHAWPSKRLAAYPCHEMIYKKMSLVLKVRSCCFHTKHNSHILEEIISTEKQWCQNYSRQTYHETIILLSRIQLHFCQCFMWWAIHCLIKMSSQSLTIDISLILLSFLLKKLFNSLQENKFGSMTIKKRINWLQNLQSSYAMNCFLF